MGVLQPDALAVGEQDALQPHDGFAVGDAEGCREIGRRGDVVPGDQDATGFAAHAQRTLGVRPQRKWLRQLGLRHHRAAAATFDAALH
jgi:hypothetical protein